MSDFKKHLEQQMKDPEFRAEYELSRPEYEIKRAMVKARCEQSITQEELSKRTGIRQSNISRIENGSCSPTIATLQQLASGMGKQLHVEFR